MNHNQRWKWLMGYAFDKEQFRMHDVYKALKNRGITKSECDDLIQWAIETGRAGMYKDDDRKRFFVVSTSAQLIRKAWMCSDWNKNLFKWKTEADLKERLTR